MKKAQATIDNVSLASSPENKLDLIGKHILIAEDNAINQMII
jgi:hypothetical protein